MERRVSAVPQVRQESRAHQDPLASLDRRDRGDLRDATANPERLVTWGNRAHLGYR